MKDKKFIKMYLLTGAIIGALLGYTAFDKKTFQITKTTLTSDKIISGIKVAILADLHGQTYGKDNKRLIRAIDEQKPDIVLFAGDMLTYNTIIGSKAYNTFLALCRNLASKYPVYYVFGNHEIDIGYKFKEDIVNTGVKLVNRDTYQVDINGNPLTIMGIYHMDSSGEKIIRKKKAYLTRQLIDDSRYKILLYHYPEKAVKYLSDLNLDVIISGHAHGGQWRFFGRGVYSPGEGLFPRYTAGVHRIGRPRLVISRGIGSHVWIPRINNPAELLILSLEPNRF